MADLIKPELTVDPGERPNVYDDIVRFLAELGLEPGEVRAGGIRLVSKHDGAVQQLEVDVRQSGAPDLYDTLRWPVEPPDLYHEVEHHHVGPEAPRG